MSFDKRLELVFYEKDGKIISRLPNGKIVLLDAAERLEVDVGIPYLVRIKELERVAFARIEGVADTFPRLIIRKSYVILVYNKKKEILPDRDKAERRLREYGLKRYLVILRDEED